MTSGGVTLLEGVDHVEHMEGFRGQGQLTYAIKVVVSLAVNVRHSAASFELGKMTITHSLFSLREKFRFFVSQYAPDIGDFCRKMMIEDHQTTLIAARSLIGTEVFLATELSTTYYLKPLVAAVRSAANDVCWRRSYSLNDLGFDKNYLDNYVWFNLIAPSGPFARHSMRLTVGVWGLGLNFPRHWHKPEEIYSPWKVLRSMFLKVALQLKVVLAQRFVIILISQMRRIFPMRHC